MRFNLAVLSAESLTTAALAHVVGKAYEGAITAILSPVQLGLSIASSVATSATVYLLMAGGKLLIAGTFLAAEKTTQGVYYLFFSDTFHQKLIKNHTPNEAWDMCDADEEPKTAKAIIEQNHNV